MTDQEKSEILLDAIQEISRVNGAAGYTVFNPAALDGLKFLHAEIVDNYEPEPETYDDALARKYDSAARYEADMVAAGRGHLVRK